MLSTAKALVYVFVFEPSEKYAEGCVTLKSISPLKAYFVTSDAEQIVKAKFEAKNSSAI